MLSNIHLCGTHSYTFMKIHRIRTVKYSEVEQSTCVNGKLF